MNIIGELKSHLDNSDSSRDKNKKSFANPPLPIPNRYTFIKSLKSYLK